MRPRSSYSLLWHFFTKLDEEFARCVICQRKYSYKSTTNNLKKHLDRQHPTAYPEDDVLQEEQTSQLSPTTGELVSEDTQDDKPRADGATDPQGDSDSFEDEQQLEDWGADVTEIDGRRRFKAWQWRHFIRVDDTRAICRLCRGEYSHQSGNSNLQRHLENKHNISERDEDKHADYEPQRETPVPERRGSVTGRGATVYQTRRKRSSVWNYFTEVNPVTAKCKFCPKQMRKDSVSNMRKHLTRTHAAFVGKSTAIMSSSRDIKPEDLDSNDKWKTDDFDDQFTGVYISEPSREDSDAEEQPQPRKRRKDNDTLEQFGRYIAALMRRLPEDISNRMQAEFVTQIMEAQIKYDNTSASETALETSRHVNGHSALDTQEPAKLILDVST